MICVCVRVFLCVFIVCCCCCRCIFVVDLLLFFVCLFVLFFVVVFSVWGGGVFNFSFYTLVKNLNHHDC